MKKLSLLISAALVAVLCISAVARPKHKLPSWPKLVPVHYALQGHIPPQYNMNTEDLEDTTVNQIALLRAASDGASWPQSASVCSRDPFDPSQEVMVTLSFTQADVQANIANYVSAFVAN